MKASSLEEDLDMKLVVAVAKILCIRESSGSARK